MRRARRAVVFMAAAFIVSAGAVAPAAAGKFGDVVAATVVARLEALPKGHFYLLDANPGDTDHPEHPGQQSQRPPGDGDGRGGRRHDGASRPACSWPSPGAPRR